MKKETIEDSIEFYPHIYPPYIIMKYLKGIDIWLLFFNKKNEPTTQDYQAVIDYSNLEMRGFRHTNIQAGILQRHLYKCRHTDKL